MDAKELYNKVMNQNKHISDDEWLEMEIQLYKWLETDPPEEDKKLFWPLGAGEIISMMADGVHYRRKTGRYADDYVPPENETVVRIDK